MYRVVNTPVIFDVLWSLISFGHGTSRWPLGSNRTG